MVRAKVAVALVAEHTPVPVTFMVRVITPPVVLSVEPKAYVGASVVPFEKVPSPLVAQEIVPLAALYAGMV
jgi:hypothetical protein